MNVCHTHSLHLLNYTTEETFLAYALLYFILPDSFTEHNQLDQGSVPEFKTMKTVEGDLMGGFGLETLSNDALSPTKTEHTNETQNLTRLIIFCGIFKQQWKQVEREMGARELCCVLRKGDF